MPRHGWIQPIRARDNITLGGIASSRLHGTVKLKHKRRTAETKIFVLGDTPLASRSLAVGKTITVTGSTARRRIYPSPGQRTRRS